MEFEKARTARVTLNRLDNLSKHNDKRDELRKMLSLQFEPQSDLWYRANELANLHCEASRQLEELLLEKLKHL